MDHPEHIGRYKVLHRLGGGGMAEVFAARRAGQAGFARTVAIKRVLPGFAQDPAFCEMFVREAQLCARLDHPNVVSVLDFDRDPHHGLFLAMEMVEGRDLAALMQTRLLPIPLVIHLAAEVLRGLGYAHNLPLDGSGVCGVIHRDVSPHNVLLSWEGAVKVSDFGIAKARGAATSASASVMVKGKPAYMSPEQANGSPLDGRSDLFAVGVMLWEMLVGRPLFARATLQEMFAALFFSPIPSPRHERPEVPDDLAAVTMGLLAREREQRYATAEDAVAALNACLAAPTNGRAMLSEILRERFAESAPMKAARAADSASSGAALGAPAPPRSAPTATTRRRLRWPPMAMFVAIGAAIGFAIPWWGGEPGRASARPAAPAPPPRALPTKLEPKSAPAPSLTRAEVPPPPAPADKAPANQAPASARARAGRRRTTPPATTGDHRGVERPLTEAPNALDGK